MNGRSITVQDVKYNFISPIFITGMSAEISNGRDSLDIEPIRLTFIPDLYLQRRIWVLDVLRREDVVSVIIPHTTCSIFIDAIDATGR